MAKVDYRRLSEQQREEYMKLLMKTLEGCGLSQEGQEFLSDLFVESEITMFARRIAIARLLVAGQSFEQIRGMLHAGLDTIASVDRWLSSKMYAYRSVVSASKRRKRKEERDDLFDLLTLRELRRKYPGRHALINLTLGDDPR